MVWFKVLCARCNGHKGAMHPDAWTDLTVHHAVYGSCGACCR